MTLNDSFQCVSLQLPLGGSAPPTLKQRDGICQDEEVTVEEAKSWFTDLNIQEEQQNEIRKPCPNIRGRHDG